jgi:carbon monoxide dehydrogenase subunit G
VKVQRTITVNKPMPQVMEYLRDFSHTQDWDPGTVRCERIDAGPTDVGPIDAGPIAVGSRWKNVSRFMGRTVELEYRLERAEPDRLTFAGQNASARATDDLRFEPHGGGTLIVYSADIQFRGVARLAAPFLKPAFNRLADEVAASMPNAIEASAHD